MAIVSSREIMDKLFTHEDKGNVHKIFGLYCTLHYVLRLLHLCFYGGQAAMGFKTWDTVTVLAVLPHAGLPLTSLFFRVLRRRLNGRSTIIWEEMRLHSIVFSLRSVIVFLLCCFPPALSDPSTASSSSPAYRILFAFFGVMWAHFLADEVTRRFGDPGASTIRVNGIDPTAGIWLLKRTYSLAQTVAVSSLLWCLLHLQTAGANVSMSLAVSFSILPGIQYAAFLMTLSRKNLISKPTYHIGYLLALVYAVIVTAVSCPLVVWVVGVTALCSRMYCPKVSKYVTWFILTALMCFVV